MFIDCLLILPGDGGGDVGRRMLSLRKKMLSRTVNPG